MTDPYTRDSSWLEPPRIPLQAWTDLLTSHSVPNASEITSAYDVNGEAAGINRDLALGQGCWEAAYYTSDRWVRQHNPAGLGITDGSVPGVDFENVARGVIAHFQHIACYALATDPPSISPPTVSIYDPHHTFHDDKPLFRDIIRPERKWAVPGTTYVDNILGLVNRLIGAAPVTTTNEPTQDDIGFPVTIDYTTYHGGTRALKDIEWLIMHDTEGYHAGDLATLKSTSGSTHALIDKDGSLTYMVPINTTAWTPGNDPVAAASINIELDGFADGRDGGYTAAQLQSAAAFYKWCVGQGCSNIPATYIGKDDSDGGPLPDDPGFLGHEDVPNPNVPHAWGGAFGHTDPGPLFDWSGFLTLCTGTNPHGASSTYRLFKETGHGIDHGFKGWWESNPDPLYNIGFPVTEEVQYGGRTTQFFQRAVVQWFPENGGTKYEFQTMLSGSKEAKDAGYSGPGIP